MDTTKTITLITGANRGMGFQIAKELGQKGQHILVGSRSADQGESAVQKLKALGIEAEYIVLDVTNKTTIEAASKYIKTQYGYLSILINNAGIALDEFQQPSQLSTDTMRKDFDVNFFGVIDVTQAMLPLLKQNKEAKIINISSIMGSLSAATDPNSQVYDASAVGYQASKAALNMWTIRLGKELQANEESHITVNSVCPGMVATEFGGATPELAREMGARPVEEGVIRTVELASSEDNSINITFSNKEGQLNW
ncbi:SDR family oxidoreductase [Staphylococcus sp. Marseille-Q5304]|uniref:SDR family oxidoreductase n=1 Tax=Staphylococcus sp. Marseille-Q5304 TaxID=2942200 RepID=UPI0020743EC6|nr:SDR family oxidoreductase [Staphylococcus sp. Marseille-Q5304]